MRIELDDEFVDELVIDGLVDTYVTLKRDIKRGKAHPEDLANWKQLVPAIKTVLEYYTYPSKLEAKIKKAMKK
jgi:hypothetical protein